MFSWQSIFIFGVLALNVVLLWRSLAECKKGRAFWLTRPLFFLGMFVWGDVLALSPFWILISGVSLLLQDWTLFLLVVSVFWLVRSLGETLYWFLQQFATVKRDPAEKLMGYSLVKNESIWFIYQVLWQCVTVVTLILTIFLSHVWLSGG